MDAQVFTLAELRERKLLGEPLGDDSDIILDPVMPGETRLGPLRDDEREIYKTMLLINAEMEDMLKEANARVLEHIAKTIRVSKDVEDFNRRMSDRKERPHVFLTEDEAEYYYELNTRYEFLRAQYNFMLRSRLGHGSAYGVRIGFEVVRVRKNYEVPPATPEPVEQTDTRKVLTFPADGSAPNGQT